MPEVGAGPGAVLLDIGGDVGAAVVVGAGEPVGTEIEIRATGRHWDGRHVAFHRRSAGGEDVVAAVFPQLTAGRWEVRLRNGSGPAVGFAVAGGKVTTVDFP